MKHTAGPWRWNYSSGSFTLETIGRGRLIVMDFVRMGMGSAQPRFAKWEGEDRGRLGGIMFKAQEMGELHDHPDARLIAAAPDLLTAAKAMLPFVRERKMEGETEYERAVLALDAAIAQAEKSSTAGSTK